MILYLTHTFNYLTIDFTQCENKCPLHHNREILYHRKGPRPHFQAPLGRSNLIMHEIFSIALQVTDFIAEDSSSPTRTSIWRIHEIITSIPVSSYGITVFFSVTIIRLTWKVAYSQLQNILPINWGSQKQWSFSHSWPSLWFFSLSCSRLSILSPRWDLPQIIIFWWYQQ